MTLIVIIGAGIGGLATALRLASAGQPVLVLERHAAVGGKMRAVQSAAGPVDAGPTVLTMRGVFDDLFAAAGTRLDDHVTLTPHRILARHWWGDGSILDLFADTDASASAIEAFCGEGDAFRRFSCDAKRLFTAFEDPMMKAPAPTQLGMARQVLRDPTLIGAMRPWHSLAGSLKSRFQDARLRQLFGRYATYVGGAPHASPALLSLIWHAEASGVWSVQGGLHCLADTLARLIQDKGGEIRCNAHVDRILPNAVIVNGEQIAAKSVVFNGDPRALHEGLLGDVKSAVTRNHVEPRSLSARVWGFAAKATGAPLVHHNVFFANYADAEFDAIACGEAPSDATLYVCAQDRGDDGLALELERFEIIENAAAIPQQEDKTLCQTRVFQRLAKMGLQFDKVPPINALTTPQGFDALFPASQGALYGRSPHGLTAGLKRPTARTAIPGLYLAGGGAHPGAGVPMAALSGLHAAEAILSDLTSTSACRQTDMRGGMSTGSAPTGRAQSRSSAS